MKRERRLCGHTFSLTTGVQISALRQTYQIGLWEVIPRALSRCLLYRKYLGEPQAVVSNLLQTFCAFSCFAVSDFFSVIISLSAFSHSSPVLAQTLNFFRLQSGERGQRAAFPQPPVYLAGVSRAALTCFWLVGLEIFTEIYPRKRLLDIMNARAREVRLLLVC